MRSQVAGKKENQVKEAKINEIKMRKRSEGVKMIKVVKKEDRVAKIKPKSLRLKVKMNQGLYIRFLELGLFPNYRWKTDTNKCVYQSIRITHLQHRTKIYLLNNKSQIINIFNYFHTFLSLNRKLYDVGKENSPPEEENTDGGVEMMNGHISPQNDVSFFCLVEDCELPKPYCIGLTQNSICRRMTEHLSNGAMKDYMGNIHINILTSFL